MARALVAVEPVAIAPTSIASTLSAPHVCSLTLEHGRELVEEVLVVSDTDAMRGVVAFAEEAKLTCRSGSSSVAATSPTATCAPGSIGCCNCGPPCTGATADL